MKTDAEECSDKIKKFIETLVFMLQFGWYLKDANEGYPHAGRKRRHH